MEYTVLNVTKYSNIIISIPQVNMKEIQLVSYRFFFLKTLIAQKFFKLATLSTLYANSLKILEWLLLKHSFLTLSKGLYLVKKKKSHIWFNWQTA